MNSNVLNKSPWISNEDAETLAWAAMLLDGGSTKAIRDMVDEYCDMHGIYGKAEPEIDHDYLYKRHVVYDEVHSRILRTYRHNYTDWYDMVHS